MPDPTAPPTLPPAELAAQTLSDPTWVFEDAEGELTAESDPKQAFERCRHRLTQPGRGGDAGPLARLTPEDFCRYIDLLRLRDLQPPPPHGPAGERLGLLRLERWPHEVFPALIDAELYQGRPQAWLVADQLRRIAEYCLDDPEDGQIEPDPARPGGFALDGVSLPQLTDDKGVTRHLISAWTWIECAPPLGRNAAGPQGAEQAFVVEFSGAFTFRARDEGAAREAFRRFTQDIFETAEITGLYPTRPKHESPEPNPAKLTRYEILCNGDRCVAEVTRIGGATHRIQLYHGPESGPLETNGHQRNAGPDAEAQTAAFIKAWTAALAGRPGAKLTVSHPETPLAPDAPGQEPEPLSEARRAAIVRQARELYATDELQVDPDARVLTTDGGFFVQGWCYVPKEDAPE